MGATAAEASRPGLARQVPGWPARGAMRVLGSVPGRAFLGSRLLVLCAGAAGALLSRRVVGWAQFDPARLTTSLGSVGNVLAASTVRWDSLHYLAIAQHGYSTAAQTVFLPLYPLLVKVFGVLVGSVVAGGTVVSVVSFAVALVVLHRLTALELGRRAADATVLVLAFAPTSFFFSAIYTESLFLALSVGSVYALRRERTGLAALLAALAALTRSTGILLLAALLALHLRARRRLDRTFCWLLAVPVALGGYLTFLSSRGISPLAPFRQEAAYDRVSTGPLDAVWSAVHHALAGLGAIFSGRVLVYSPSLAGPLTSQAESIYLLAVLAVAVLALLLAFKRLPLGYGAYAALGLLACIWSPVPAQPLKSFDRYALTLFPLAMAAGAWISERRLTRAAVLLSGVLLALFTFQAATWAFIA